MIIAITGKPGSGKSTAARLLAEQLGWPWYSMGDLRGKMALERGLTIDELNALGEREAFTDKEIDDYQTKLGQTENHFVIDGRLSWYFIPHALKVFLDVDPAEGGRRIYAARQSKNERSDELAYTSPQEAARYAAGRIESDSKRYQKYYGVNFLNQSNYDLTIDTTHTQPEDVVNEILALYRQRKTAT